MIRLLPALCLAAFALAAPQARADQGGLYGVWRNPHDSVHLDIRPCGAVACGYVVWASPKAQADARRGSGQDLVGQQLLHDFTPSKGGWRGKVFVPDLNRTFSGSARMMDGGHLEAQGCLIGNILCKRQIWTRLGEVQAAR
jgi:uncharacterized protein (DUF2147 family)